MIPWDCFTVLVGRILLLKRIRMQQNLNYIMKRGKKYIGSKPGTTLCQIMREVYYGCDDEGIKEKSKLVMIGAKEIVDELKKNKELFRKDHRKDVKERAMGIRKHKPVSIKKIENQRYQGHHTICQFLRDIYTMTENEDIKMKCRIGMSMAKSMHERLKKYRQIMNGKIVAKVEGDEVELEKINTPK